ncbi:MAG TPA: hypothetical protein VFB22_08130 [Candidatus Baltobacteraceae bacterium]|nr:hypothetical protein [Candidatus Baltobacteraceae bacterium]
MRSLSRAAAALAAVTPLLVVLVRGPAAPVAMMQPIPSPTPPKPPCVRDTVVLLDNIDTSTAQPGESFRIQTVDPARTSDGIDVPIGVLGYGVVAIAHHADRGGKGGYVVIETRYLALPDGRHVQATLDWKEAANATATGSSRNVPGIVGWIPFSGYVLGPYGFLHHGADITIQRGARLEVLLGDDVASGACVEPPPPSPLPGATSLPDRDVERRQAPEAQPAASSSPAP